MAEENQATEAPKPPEPTEAPKPSGPWSLKLPSGKIATRRKWKGKDLINAYRAVPGDAGSMEKGYALLAMYFEIDGKPFVYEDVLEMDGDDLMALMTNPVFLGNFKLPAALLGPPSSPALSSTGSAQKS